MVKFIDFFKEKVHPVIRALLINNVLSLTGWAFINPIFAIYVIQSIHGGSIKTVGVCYAIYWVVKGFLQLFVSHYLDRVEGEADDYFTLVLGQFLNMLVPIALFFSKNSNELYFIFCIYGIADALLYPPWNAIFTRYINPKRVSFEWALNSTGVNFGSAVAVLIGSSLVLIFGFPLIFLFVIVAQGISLGVLLSIRRYFVHKKKSSIEYYFPFKT
ncbi:MAG: MFS transporter [Candidatus Paceibacterota bacterium]|jgi:MFS family permease